MADIKLIHLVHIMQYFPNVDTVNVSERDLNTVELRFKNRYGVDVTYYPDRKDYCLFAWTHLSGTEWWNPAGTIGLGLTAELANKIATAIGNVKNPKDNKVREAIGFDEMIKDVQHPQGANLRGAIFTNANLTGAKF